MPCKKVNFRKAGGMGKAWTLEAWVLDPALPQTHVFPRWDNAEVVINNYSYPGCSTELSKGPPASSVPISYVFLMRTLLRMG